MPQLAVRTALPPMVTAPLIILVESRSGSWRRSRLPRSWLARRHRSTPRFPVRKPEKKGSSLERWPIPPPNYPNPRQNGKAHVGIVPADPSIADRLAVNSCWARTADRWLSVFSAAPGAGNRRLVNSELQFAFPHIPLRDIDAEPGAPDQYGHAQGHEHGRIAAAAALPPSRNVFSEED